MSPSLPTRKEINFYDELCSRDACQHFFGKSLEEAEALFRENPLYYGFDLLWMGPVAFRFYLPAAIRFIVSDHAALQSGFIKQFCDTLSLRLVHELFAELVPVAEQLADICDYIVGHWSKFDVDEKIYGSLQRSEVVQLQQIFKQLPTTPPLNTTISQRFERTP